MVASFAQWLLGHYWLLLGGCYSVFTKKQKTDHYPVNNIFPLNDLHVNALYVRIICVCSVKLWGEKQDRTTRRRQTDKYDTAHYWNLLNHHQHVSENVSEN